MPYQYYPCVLTIAGSDCSGGAGIQADIKTISALGAYAASAITAVTVQNTCGVTDVHPVPAHIVAAQIETVMNDLHPDAIKIGMVNDADVVRAIARTIFRFRPRHVVFDPVMISSSGRKLMSDEAIETIRTELFPLCTLITPNIDEAAFLLQRPICSVGDMETAASQLLCYGSQAVLLKGGHLKDDLLTDVLQKKDPPHTYLYSAPKVETRNTHGTGCTLSAAIASYLALGHPLEEAVRQAKDYVHQCLEAGKDIWAGHGHGSMNHLHHPVPMYVLNGNRTNEQCPHE